MKKLLSILVLSLLFIGNVKAELVEINNCMRVEDYGDVYDPLTEKFIPFDEFLYSKDTYDFENLSLKVSKKAFRENYKKWGWDKKKSDDWYKHFDPFRNPKSLWKLSGTNITSTEKEKPGLILFDPWLENIEDRFYNDIFLPNLLGLTEDELDKYTSIGAKIFKKKNKNVWSIDYPSKTITHLTVLSDEQYEYEKIRIAKMKSTSKGLDGKPTNLDFLVAERVKTTQYRIESYAGGIMVAKEPNSILKKKIVIDFSNMTIIETYEINGSIETIARYKCPTGNDSDTNETSGSSGTAFFINSRGHLLTNNHVVQGCELSKISYGNKDYDARLIATDETLDLALLKVDIKPKSFFVFSKDEVKKLNKVYVAGYPLGKGLSDDLKISSGIVSSLKGYQDNSNEIQIDAPINRGNSGGPIVNENGDLVAIAVSGLAKDQTEGINFGIKSSAAETFLRSNKINPKKSMYAGIKDNDKLLEILEEGTVYTYCD